MNLSFRAESRNPVALSGGSVPGSADFAQDDNSSYQRGDRNSRMKKWIAVLLIAIAVTATYAPALQNDFVWDDTALILRDPLIRSWRLIPEGFNHYLFTDATASNFYRPIQRLSYTFEYAGFIFHPAVYHVTSIACHIAASIALFFFAEELLLSFGIGLPRRRLIAFFPALVWAIHPAHSAAVAYVSGRADPLAALFGFLGSYLVLRSVRTTPRNKFLLLIAAVALFLLSGLSKESGLIFPVLTMSLLAVGRNWKAIFKTIVVAVCVGVVYVSLRLPAEHVQPPVVHQPAPASVRPIIIARALAEYAGLILLPVNLHMDRDVETHPTGFNDPSLSRAARRELQTLLGILLAAGIVYWMANARHRCPPVFACLILAIITYLPVSGIVALNATVAEHWLYLPSAFLFLAVAIEGIDFFSRRGSTIRAAFLTIIFLWILFLGVRSFARAFDWKDQRTFVERTIASGGRSARMLINLAGAEINEGKLSDAAIHLHEALQKSPNEPLAVLNLAAVALKQNDFRLARELLNSATQMPAVDAQAHELLAVLNYKEKGTVDLLRLRLAARTGPPNWSIEKRYVKVLDEAGATKKAIDELENCLRTEWYRAETWQLLSHLLAKDGREEAASIALAKANAYDVHLDAQTAP